jgi:hypothetical protein
MLNIVVYQISDFHVIAFDMLDLDHLPIVLYIPDHATTKHLLELRGYFIDWERFQSLGSNLISLRTNIN